MKVAGCSIPSSDLHSFKTHRSYPAFCAIWQDHSQDACVPISAAQLGREKWWAVVV